MHQGRPAPLAKENPPWTRTRWSIQKPSQPVARGSRGLLLHYDLANHNSVMAILTEDIGCASRGRLLCSSGARRVVRHVAVPWRSMRCYWQRSARRVMMRTLVPRPTFSPGSMSSAERHLTFDAGPEP